MWENLTTINPSTGVSVIEPQLASSWEVSPDASEYTFHLRKGVQLHFGYGEFNVDDVILTIDQQMSDPLNVRPAGRMQSPAETVYGR